MAFEAGRPDQARAIFERAVSLAPENSAAVLSLAESQIRADLPEGDASSKRAASLLTGGRAKADAFLLPARIAQEKGNLAAAWAALRKLESEALPLEVRLALIPEFARAHLAAGDCQAWAESLAAKKDIDGSAQYAAACIALGDPALGYRVVIEHSRSMTRTGTCKRLQFRQREKRVSMEMLWRELKPYSATRRRMTT